MLVRMLPAALALVLLGQVAVAANSWSEPYIITPLEYKELSFAKRQASLDRRRVWDDVGQLTSRQSTCNPGFSECPSGAYCHAAGSFCCSTDESQACPNGATCCSQPGNAANITGCAAAGATCCGEGGQCEAGRLCCTGPDGPPGCALASNTCCGARAQCTSEQQCCGVAGGQSLGCAPKDATCCTLNNWCVAGSSCCSAEDGSKYCSPVCCGEGVDCQVGDKCCMNKSGQRFCAQSCDQPDPTRTPVPTPTPDPTPKSSSLSTGAIIGIAVGGIAVLAIIAALVIFRCRQSRTHDKPPPAAVAYNPGPQPGMGQVSPYDPMAGAPAGGAYGAAPVMLAGAHAQHQFQQPPQPYGQQYQQHGMPVPVAASPHHHTYATAPVPPSPYGSDRPMSLHSQLAPPHQFQSNALAISTTSGPTPPQTPMMSDYSPNRTSTPGTAAGSPPPSSNAPLWNPSELYGAAGGGAYDTSYGAGAGVKDKNAKETMYAAPVHRQSSGYGPSGSGGPSGIMSPGQEAPPPLYEEGNGR